MPIVFVYGSLLGGEGNHHVMRGGRLLGPAATLASYRLVDLGSYPALVEGGSVAVVGELYEVSDAHLGALDRFEGHPSFYVRAAIELSAGGQAEAYLLPASRARGASEIASGDWRKHRRRGEGS
jgi:gamma-glutamylaminecyclotransferase